MQARKLAKEIRELCDEKKGEDIIVLDVRKMSDITSFFVIASGNTTRHVNALSDHVSQSLRKKGLKAWHIEGVREATWIVLDYSDVIVHLFCSEIRGYYNLERLWGDAPRIS